MSDLNHHSETEPLELATSRLRGLSCPPGPPDRLMTSTVDALNAAAQLPPPEIQPATRQPVVRRVMRFVAAAALIAMTASVFFLFDRNATVAWAQMVENVKKARSVSFILKQKSGERPELSSRMILRDSVLRLELADVMVLILDVDSRQEIELDTVRKIARKSTVEGRIPAEELKSPIDRLRNLGKGDKDKVTILGDEERDGVRCKVFQIDSPAAVPVGGKFKLWADAKTNLPVRIEAGDEQMSVVYESFRWDDPLADDLFRLDVPKGYLVDEPSPAVIQPGRIYYHHGSTALSSLAPDGQNPETQFVPRAEAPVTYASDRSELTPDGRYLAISYSRIDNGAYPPDRVLLWDRTRPEQSAVEVYHRPEGEMQFWQFSPDGKRLYVSYWEQIPGMKEGPGRYGTDMVNLETKVITPVNLPTYKDAEGNEVQMRFGAASADGTHYLVVGGGLHLANAKGEVVRRLTPTGTRINPRTVGFSPDGRQALFVGVEADRSQRLCTVTIDGGKVHELTPESTYVDIRPRWSPDGRQIAFSSRAFAPNSEPFRFGTETSLKVISAEGTDERTLLNLKVPPQATSLELIGWR